MRAASQCGAARPSPLICPACRAIEAPEGDAFALIGLPRSWAVDQKELETRYGTLRRLLEHEAGSSRPEETRRKTSAAIAVLDTARRELSDPLARGRSLLLSYGGKERDKAVDSSEFLMQVMEVKRAAEQARGQKDETRLAAVIQEAEEKLATLLMAAGQSFARLEKALREEVIAAADSLAAAKYWSGVMNELRGKRVESRESRAGGREFEVQGQEDKRQNLRPLGGSGDRKVSR